MENFLIMLGLFVLCFLIFGVIGILVYFLLKPLPEYLQFYPHIFTNKCLKNINLSFVVFCAGYIAFTAVYPTDDFYFGEFETITLRKIPDSAKVLTKSATYPDLHGDYQSKAIIELLESDYQQLFEQIQQDKAFEPLSDENNIIEFQQIIKDRENKLYYVRFYPNGKTIEIFLINY